MSNRNERESYPYKNQGRPQRQENDSNKFAMLMIIAWLIVLLIAYLTHNTL